MHSHIQYATSNRNVWLFLKYSNTTKVKNLGHRLNSLIATTSRKRPPPVSDHLVNNRFVSQLNTVSSSLVSNHHSNFLRGRDHFLGQKLHIFFCFLFLVSDHPTLPQGWSLTGDLTVFCKNRKLGPFCRVDLFPW